MMDPTTPITMITLCSILREGLGRRTLFAKIGGRIIESIGALSEPNSEMTSPRCGTDAATTAVKATTTIRSITLQIRVHDHR